MAPTSTAKTPATPAAKEKKEKLFHPASRKAGQLARHAIRKGRIGNLKSKRSHKHNSLVDLYGFFFYALPEEGVLSLSDVHQLISDIWLTRHDDDLAAEVAARRKGRPKSATQQRLEDLKLREAEIYRTGMEIIDLTHPPTVALFRRWDAKEVAYIGLLRFIRVCSTDLELALVSRPGTHFSIVGSSEKGEGGEVEGEGEEMEMDQ